MKNNIHLSVKDMKRSLSSSNISNGEEKKLQHDAMFNNRNKVAFESALASILFTNNECFDTVINKTISKLKKIIVPVLHEVLDYYKNEDLKNIKNKAKIALFKCLTEEKDTRYAYEAYKNNTTGKYPYTLMAKIPDTINEKKDMVSYYENHVLSTNNNKNTIEEKLTIIYNIGDFISRPFKFSSNKISVNDIDFIDKIIINTMTENIKKYKEAKATGLFAPDGNHPSESRYTRIHKTDIKKNISGEYAGIYPVLAKRPNEPFNNFSKVKEFLINPIYDISGVGLWQPGVARRNIGKDGSDFASKAIKYDMPLIAGASGGIGSLMNTFCVIGKIEDIEEKKLAFLAATIMFILKGYHSFHEAAIIGKYFGIPYKIGNYSSTFPKGLVDKIPDLKKLMTDIFPSIK